jgi:alpha-amylase/alpha-mannosidase (GH57 family)
LVKNKCMNKDDFLEEIEKGLGNLSCEYFKKLWNHLFSEEKIDEVNKVQKEDLEELMLEEISFFETEKLKKIYKFIEAKS